MNDLLKLINEYLGSVEQGMKLFDGEIGRRDVLFAWHKGQLAQTGYLPGDVEYELHGVGCFFSFPDFDVDFDFGPGGRSDGFDLWRLGKYVRQFPDKYPSLLNKGSLEMAFEELGRDGLIAQPFLPDSSLYILTPAATRPG